jgi:hypothetical protein
MTVKARQVSYDDSGKAVSVTTGDNRAYCQDHGKAAPPRTSTGYPSTNFTSDNQGKPSPGYSKVASGTHYRSGRRVK